ncbi:MAG: high-potential iron-sulfur protein [Steroidobacteraceae bacterium]
MSESLSRRSLLKSIAVAAGTAAAAQTLVAPAQAQAAKPAAAAAKPNLDPKDPAAVALGYHEDSTKVDAKKFPMHKANQFCNNCLQIQGKPGEAHRGCNLFPKNLVADKGWCKVWVKKPGTA